MVLGSYEGDANVGGDPLPFTEVPSYFLAKYDADDVFLWSQPVDEFFIRSVHLAVDSTNSIVIAGSYAESMELDNTLRRDIFVRKFSEDGNLIWSTQLGGQTYGFIENIEIDDAGDIVLGGIMIEDIQVGPIQLKTTGNADGFVANLTAEGEISWAAHFGGEDFDRAKMVTVTPEGQVAVLGSHYEETPGLGITRTNVIQTYDANGSLQSDWGFVGRADTLAWAQNGKHLYLNATFDSLQPLGRNTKGISGEFLARVSPEGDVFWHVPADEDKWQDMAVDKQDRVHLISNSDADKNGKHAAFMTSYSKFGTKSGSTKIIDSKGIVRAQAIATGPDQRIAVTGCLRANTLPSDTLRFFVATMEMP